eukprot:4605796-Lingulodinium_polyedra.AAC.2
MPPGPWHRPGQLLGWQRATWWGAQQKWCPCRNGPVQQGRRARPLSPGGLQSRNPGQLQGRKTRPAQGCGPLLHGRSGQCREGL